MLWVSGGRKMEVLLAWWNRRSHQHQARTTKPWLCPEMQGRWWSRGSGCTTLPVIQSLRRRPEQQPFSFSSSSSHKRQQGPGDTLGCGGEGRQLSNPSSAASYHKVMDEQQGLLLNGDGGSMQLVNRDAPAWCQAVK